MNGDVLPAQGSPEETIARNASGAALDLRPLQTLLSRIEATFHAPQVWLFGSRARGEASPESDWDVFVVVPDETEESGMDPRVAWRLQRGSGVHADVIPCRATDFRNARDTVNTLSYVVAREGVLIRGS